MPRASPSARICACLDARSVSKSLITTNVFATPSSMRSLTARAHILSSEMYLPSVRAASTSVRIDGSFIVVPETTPARPRTVPAASLASLSASTPPLPPVETRSSDTPSSSGRVKVHTERVSSPQKTAYGSTFGDSDYVPNPSARQPHAGGPHGGPAASRTMDESFVVLPWSAGASVMHGGPGAQSQQSGPSGGSQGAPMPPQSIDVLVSCLRCESKV